MQQRFSQLHAAGNSRGAAPLLQSFVERKRGEIIYAGMHYHIAGLINQVLQAQFKRRLHSCQYCRLKIQIQPNFSRKYQCKIGGTLALGPDGGGARRIGWRIALIALHLCLWSMLAD